MTQIDMQDKTPEETKERLRAIRTVPPNVKAAVYGGMPADGNKAIGLATQFNYDVRVYGLWEAVLYVASYEKEGYYKPGTAEKAWQAAIADSGRPA